MSVIKNANLAVAFLLELFMLFAFGYWGFHVGSEATLHWILGLGVPLIVIVFWSIFMAPRSARKVSKNLHSIMQLVLFGVAAICLAVAGQPNWALAFAGLTVVNLLLSYVWRQ